MKSKYEIQFIQLCKTYRLPEPVQEHRFHPIRKWRFDFAFIEQKIAVEINGGVWKFGRHNRGQGYINDLGKINTAVIMGWRVLSYTPQTMCNAVLDLKYLLGGKL